MNRLSDTHLFVSHKVMFSNDDVTNESVNYSPNVSALIVVALSLAPSFPSRRGAGAGQVRSRRWRPCAGRTIRQVRPPSVPGQCGLRSVAVSPSGTAITTSATPSVRRCLMCSFADSVRREIYRITDAAPADRIRRPVVPSVYSVYMHSFIR